MDIPLAHLGLSLVAGSLTTLSPCVFPILPLVLGGAVQANRLAPLAMGVGMAISFALIGAYRVERAGGALAQPIEAVAMDKLRHTQRWQFQV